MNILLIGSGGREHAIAKALIDSPGNNKIFCSPGNPGIFKIALDANIDINAHESVKNFCLKNSIQLIVIGPEQPLADGLSDYLREFNLSVFGPSKKAAQLETSKKFAKEFMKKYRIPTADFESFNSNQAEAAHKYIDSKKLPIVIKADGLAAGKGVVIPDSYDEAHIELDSFFSGKFSDAGKTIVIEEFMDGEEASVFAVSDGNDFILLASAQDHKRIFDDDLGPNTGGMGAYAPAPIVTESILKKVADEIIRPAIDGMKFESSPFIGCLYAGLMIKEDSVKVVEFNVRFGDPETQSVLTLFKGDFAGLLKSAADGSIDKSLYDSNINEFACSVILASDGYPDKFEKGFEIKGVDSDFGDKTIVYHSGTKLSDGKLITNGGRVLAITSVANTLKESIELVYNSVNCIDFKNKYFRKDIGLKGLKRL